MTSPYYHAYFLLSVADVKQLPTDDGAEVAIVGRSNSGKSSVLNQLTHNMKLARVSKTPGRTQLLNFFAIDANRRLVDLPGYGYAKVPLAAKEKWQRTIEDYFAGRQSLNGLVLVMDSRHPFKPLDEQLIAYCAHHSLPLHILLNKADKLSKNEQLMTLTKARNLLKNHPNISVQLFSAKNGQGVKELYSILDEWYGYKI